MSTKEPTDEELDALSCSARILGLHRASLKSIRHFGRRVWLECTRAHAAMSAPAWQPIETAPKERGGLVDIICDGRRYAGCHYDRICDEYRHITACGVLIRLKGATHWMDIPAAPGFQAPVTAQGEQP